MRGQIADMANRTHILLVEDDPEIARLVAGFLERTGFRVTHFPDGKGVSALVEADPPDLILLDLLLPGEDGISIARRVRAVKNIPIIMLTAMTEERDRISGLDLGADDYVTKPFSTRELAARIRAVLRRTSSQVNGKKLRAVEYAFAGWTLNAQRRDLTDPSGVQVELTSAEFDLLQIFCDHAGQVLGRDDLMHLAHGRKVEPYDRSVDTQISRLRSKIEPEQTSPSLIKTVRHSGYVFTASVMVTQQ
jgi:two-component system, OmpR family, response regulator